MKVDWGGKLVWNWEEIQRKGGGNSKESTVVELERGARKGMKGRRKIRRLEDEAPSSIFCDMACGV